MTTVSHYAWIDFSIIEGDSVHVDMDECWLPLRRMRTQLTRLFNRLYAKEMISGLPHKRKQKLGFSWEMNSAE